MTLDLTPPARSLTELLDGVRLEHLDAPTPCGDFTVAALLDHVMGFARAFTLIARREQRRLDTEDFEPGAEKLDPAWREVLPERLADMARAWQAPGVLEGETTTAGIHLPNAVWLQVANNEAVVHGWDLARATGQRYHGDEAAVQAAYAFMRPDAENREPTPAFGAAILLPDDHALIDRTVAVSGHDPDWRPATV